MDKEFSELIFFFFFIVHKICNLYFSDRLDKDDYHQEIIIQLWKAYPSFNGSSRFSTWMYRVCLNAAIDLLRKEKTQPKLVRVEQQDLHNFSESGSGTHENKEKLYRAINTLSDIDKAIITLYLDEFSYKEIAKIMGISESNTGVKINRIKSYLLNYLSDGI